MVVEAESQQEGNEALRAYVLVRGIVQGVGFRPFVHRIARVHELSGWVLNSTEGVEIEVEGAAAGIRGFLDDLSEKTPPLASIHRIDVTYLPPTGYSSFVIETSQVAPSGFPLISPDIATCPDCLSELLDAGDRRYRYPFINCTNCGPRLTIVEGMPYDRPKTTMKAFAMCPACKSEYDDPANRRFHAQPNACPTCGPALSYVSGSPETGDALTLALSQKERGPDGLSSGAAGKSGGVGGSLSLSKRESPLGAVRVLPYSSPGSDPIEAAKRLLKSGSIVAVKGLGGYHLACDAANLDAVRTLRARKRRVEKPFAVMARDLETVSRLCHLEEAEAQLLQSARRPIVILERRPEGPVLREVAPGSRRLGVMLPYTPVHHVLLHPSGDISFDALVMTSGNLSEEPIAKDDDEALSRLATLADGFLLHDRPIHMRCDDSVTQVFAGKETIVRRSRGYAPLPVRLDFDLEPVLACGAELKSTFCIGEGSYAFLSQHIGDLENQETLDFYSESVDHFIGLFNLNPRIIAHDLHPHYLSTRYAISRQSSSHSTLVAVQHHHAHIASCMAENGLDERVIGVAFDGTGYGRDGSIWGGEFLIADYLGFERAAHLKYVPLPGGETAIRKPYRMALSHLFAAFGDCWPDVEFLETLDSYEVETVRTQIARRINSPNTSSIGRLFDGVSALLGIRGEISYEGQAAIELEMTARNGIEDAYQFGLSGQSPLEIDASPVIRSIVDELRRGEAREVIAARFHNGVASMIARTCEAIRRVSGRNKVCLSGGVFQNRFLLSRTLDILQRAGFETYMHHQVPCNDGGISLGQAIVASKQEKERNA